MTRSLFDDRTVADVIRRINRLTPDTAPRWGRMSAGAMLCHLGDYFDMALGNQPAAAAVPRWMQPLVRIALLHWVGPYPRNARTLPELLRTVSTDFGEDRLRLVNAIEAFAARRYDTTWPPSPIAGRITGPQWARLAHDHVIHHLRQFGL